jgi:hypothetical protein
MRQIKIYDVSFLNVAAILRVGEEGLMLFKILLALVKANSTSLVRHTDHLTSADWSSAETGKFFRTAIKYITDTKTTQPSASLKIYGSSHTLKSMVVLTH